MYDWYVDRGEPENWLKDLKNALEADRLSDHRFWATAFRLLLHAAAYWLDTLRRCSSRPSAMPRGYSSTTTPLHDYATPRLRLIKIGARVREFPGTLRLHLASSRSGMPSRHAPDPHK